MSGFEAYNSAGKLMVDSSNRTTSIYDLRNTGSVTDKGTIIVTSTFGNGTTLGYLNSQFWNDGSSLRWMQMNSGRYGMPGADFFEDNAGRVMRTRRSVAIESGYLDVFNATGSLVWSAVTASKAPRIIDFLDIPAGYDLTNNTFVKSVSFSPWILINSCPGNVTYDGETTGYSGLMIKWDGTNLLARYVSQLQKTWAQTFQSTGLRIPLAVFTGY